MRKKSLLTTTIGLISLGACTSFAFPQSRGDAPSELLGTAQMIKIHAGDFSMGETQGEPHEYPVHSVRLSAFLIDRFEVRNADYQRCVDVGVCRRSKQMDNPEFGPLNHPVVGVTYFDAKKYCQWLKKDLPTEAQWERAARGEDGRRYPFVGAVEVDKANLRGASDGYAKTAPVGHFKKGCTPEGVCDLAGNAAEWVRDWFSPTYYAESPDRDPAGPDVSTRTRCVRGGSWTSNSYQARATARDSLDPAYSSTSIGFRCARNQP